MGWTVALGCAAVLLLLLAVPLHLHLSLKREECVEARVRLVWLFGLVRYRLHPGAEGDEPKSEKEPSARKGRRRSRFARRLGRGLLHPQLRARTAAYLRDLVRALRPRDLRLRARIGMDDPADTGQLWAVLGPLALFLSRADARLVPDFQEACLRFQATGRVRVVPLQLIYLTLAYLLSPPMLRALVAG